MKLTPEVKYLLKTIRDSFEEKEVIKIIERADKIKPNNFSSFLKEALAIGIILRKNLEQMPPEIAKFVFKEM